MIEITKIDGSIIFRSETARTTKEAVEEAVKNAVSLSYADLSYADLSYADLSYADLRYADLRYADLRYANLSYADLSSDDLSYADLRYANLRYANLRYADLSYANLGYANLGAKGLTKKTFGLSGTDDDLALRVAQAVSSPSALNMNAWHTCSTTHCIAGWAIHLSGDAGYALEAATSPSVAGSMLLPSASHIFYSTNDEALDWAKGVIANASKQGMV